MAITENPFDNCPFCDKHDSLLRNSLMNDNSGGEIKHLSGRNVVAAFELKNRYFLKSGRKQQIEARNLLFEFSL